jgi:hypothetical protein
MKKLNVVTGIVQTLTLVGASKRRDKGHQINDEFKRETHPIHAMTFSLLVCAAVIGKVLSQGLSCTQQYGTCSTLEECNKKQRLAVPASDCGMCSGSLFCGFGFNSTFRWV